MDSIMGGWGEGSWGVKKRKKVQKILELQLMIILIID